MKKEVIRNYATLFARGMTAGVGLAAGLALTALLAQTATAWTGGETLTSTKLNAVITDLGTLFGDARWTKNGSDAVYTAGNVGMGRVPNTSTRLDLKAHGTNTTVIRAENSANTNSLFRVLQDVGNNGVVNVAGTDGVTDVQLGSDAASSYFTGNVGIGTTSPARRLDVRTGSAADGNIVASFGEDLTGFYVARFNVGGDLDRHGVMLQGPVGTLQYIWADDSGNLRIMAAGGGYPSAQSAGTVIGTQTSARDTKQDIDDFSSTDSLLNKVLSVKLHTFYYKTEAKGYGKEAKRKLGFIADEVDPLFMREYGRSIDQVSVNGILIGATQEQQKHIDALRARAERAEKENGELRTRLGRIESALSARGMIPPASPSARADDEVPAVATAPGIVRRALRWLW